VKSSFCLGGVARNIAENLARLDLPVFLVSHIGRDPYGDSVLSQLKPFQIDTSFVSRSPKLPTATYTAFLEPDGELFIATAEMDIYDEITPHLLGPQLKVLGNLDLLVLDSNLKEDALRFIADHMPRSLPIWGIPVSVAKAGRFKDILSRLNGIILNQDELSHLVQRPMTGPMQIKQACTELMDRGIATVIVTCGGQGVIAAQGANYFSYILKKKQTNLDVTGAGDAFSAGVLFGLQHDCSLSEAIQYGMASARLTLQSSATVNPDLNPLTLLTEVNFTPFELAELL
jgi:pseudouridine kinase